MQICTILNDAGSDLGKNKADISIGRSNASICMGKNKVVSGLVFADGDQKRPVEGWMKIKVVKKYRS